MLPSNRTVLQQMFADEQYRQFTFGLADLLKPDPGFSFKRQAQILRISARGERIVPFEDVYVVNSSVPPVPSKAFATFIEGGQNKDRLLSDLAYARRSAPLSAHLCITARCNYHCEHCGATVPDQQSELSKDQWLGIIARLQELGVAYIVFSGGEPLLRPDMEEILASVDDRSTTLLFTNGRDLTPRRAQSLKEAGLFILAVSLDSPHPDEHNRLRRAPHAYEDALSAIRNASDAGLYTLVSAVIYRCDLTEKNVVELARLVQQRGAHELRIHQPIPRGKLAHSAEADTIFYKDEDISRLHEIQFAMNNASHGFPKISSLSYTEGPCKFGCGAGVLHSYISATGELWPCDFVPLSFGNVLEEDLAQLYARMRDAVGIPKNCCWARKLARALADRQLPLDTDASLALALADRSSSYPQFFTDLQTVPVDIPVPGNGSRPSGVAHTASSRSDLAKALT